MALIDTGEQAIKRSFTDEEVAKGIVGQEIDKALDKIVIHEEKIKSYRTEIESHKSNIEFLEQKVKVLNDLREAYQNSE